MTEHNHALNQALIDAMAARNVSDDELARLAGVSPKTVSGWRTSRRPPTYPVAEKVAPALAVAPADLWPHLDRQDDTAERRRTAAAVAAATGASPSTVRQWLAGRRRPNPVAAACLAAAGLTLPGWPEAPMRQPRPAHLPGGDAIPLTVRQVLALPSAPPDRRWRKRALCANADHDPDLWWPEPGDPGVTARLLCAACPVLAACRDAFLADPWSDHTCIIAGVKASTLLQHNKHTSRPTRPRRIAA